MTFQQQLRQEVADVIQQLRAEVNEAIGDRMDMMHSISAALQRVTAKPAESKPYRISDLIPRNWEGGKCRHLVVAGKLVDEQLGGREDVVCKEDSLGTAGGAHRSYVWALHSVGVESREAGVTPRRTLY